MPLARASELDSREKGNRGFKFGAQSVAPTSLLGHRHLSGLGGPSGDKEAARAVRGRVSDCVLLLITILRF